MPAYARGSLRQPRYLPHNAVGSHANRNVCSESCARIRRGGTHRAGKYSNPAPPDKLRHEGNAVIAGGRRGGRGDKQGGMHGRGNRKEEIINAATYVQANSSGKVGGREEKNAKLIGPALVNTACPRGKIRDAIRINAPLLVLERAS